MKTYRVAWEYGIQVGQIKVAFYRAKNEENAVKRFLREHPGAKTQLHNITVRPAELT